MRKRCRSCRAFVFCGWINATSPICPDGFNGWKFVHQIYVNCRWWAIRVHCRSSMVDLCSRVMIISEFTIAAAFTFQFSTNLTSSLSLPSTECMWLGISTTWSIWMILKSVRRSEHWPVHISASIRWAVVQSNSWNVSIIPPISWHSANTIRNDIDHKWPRSFHPGHRYGRNHQRPLDANEEITLRPSNVQALYLSLPLCLFVSHGVFLFSLHLSRPMKTIISSFRVSQAIVPNLESVDYHSPRM